MFVGSGKDSSLILRLQDAYDHTNDAIWGLSRWIPVTSQPKFASREVYEQWIQNFRYDVFTLDKTIEEVLEFYTNANADFIHWIINTLKVIGCLAPGSRRFKVKFYFITFNSRFSVSFAFLFNNFAIDLRCFYYKVFGHSNVELRNTIGTRKCRISHK